MYLIIYSLGGLLETDETEEQRSIEPWTDQNQFQILSTSLDVL